MGRHNNGSSGGGGASDSTTGVFGGGGCGFLVFGLIAMGAVLLILGLYWKF